MEQAGRESRGKIARSLIGIVLGVGLIGAGHGCVDARSGYKQDRIQTTQKNTHSWENYRKFLGNYADLNKRANYPLMNKLACLHALKGYDEAMSLSEKERKECERLYSQAVKEFPDILADMPWISKTSPNYFDRVFIGSEYFKSKREKD